MEIKFTYPITREFIRAHPEIIFIYGKSRIPSLIVDNSCESVCSGCSNTYGVTVKHKFCAGGGFWMDDYFYVLNRELIYDDLIDVSASEKPRFYFPKIGMGGSMLNVKAPETYKYLIEILNTIATPITYERTTT